MPEISQEELTLLQQARRLLDTVYSDPEDGLTFKQMLKKKFPKMSIPEIDAAAPHVAKIQELSTKLEDFIKKAGDEKMEADFLKRFTRTREEFNLTDDGMERVKKLMVDQNIPDPRAAAALLVHDTPLKPIEPTGLSGRWDFLSGDTKEEQDDIASLINDPDAWLERQIPKIVAEERNKQRLPIGGV